jgi:hypothetical protein
LISPDDTAHECISPKLHGSRRFGQAKRSLGRQQAPAGAFEQNQSKLGFKLGHMSTDGGLAGLQLSCSGKKTSLFKYSKE